MTIPEIQLQALGFLSADDTKANRLFALAGINAAWTAAEQVHDFTESWQRGWFMVGDTLVPLSCYDTVEMDFTLFQIRQATGFEQYDPVTGIHTPLEHVSIRSADLLERRSTLLGRGGHQKRQVLQLGNRVMLSDLPSEPVQLRVSGFVKSDPWLQTGDGPYTITGGPNYNTPLEEGWEYLMWYAVCFMNYKFQVFTPRQEGTLTPPEKSKADALDRLITWDTFNGVEYQTHKILAS